MGDIRQDLQLFQELKDSSLPETTDTLEELISKKDIYDINPNTNYAILEKSLKESQQNFKNIFIDYNQTLTFHQRQEIIGKIKNTEVGKIISEKIGLSNESFMEKYFNILNELKKFINYKSMKKYQTIKKLFETYYYVDNKSIKIPLIYGTNELRYSGLINNLYQSLFFNKIKIENENDIEENEFNKKDKNIKNNQEKSNNEKKDNNDIIIRRKDNNNEQNKTKLDNVKINDSTITPMNIDSDENEEEKFIYFKNISIFISDFINIICSDEFHECFNVKNKYQLDKKENFNLEYKLNPEIDSLYFHLLFFDLILTIYSSHGKTNYNDKLKHVFFEKKEIKLTTLEVLKKFCKIFFAENGKEISFNNLNDIQNKDYKIIDLANKDNFFIFNPYDYIFNNIDAYSVKNFQDIINLFNNPKYFSLNRIYKNKKLFADQKLFESFQNNIKDMLKTNVIYQLYNQFEHFKSYKNPYQGDKKDKFIEQTFKVLLYMPIPFTHIAGYTYKNFGIIFLDSKEISKRNALPNTYFLKNITNVSFKKVVSIHEIICHYCSCLIHGNEVSCGLITPEDSLIDYCAIEGKEEKFLTYDAGDKGESLLFGDKIKYIFIKGALFILNNENYKKNIEEFRKEFTEFNNPDKYIKGEFNVQEEIKNNNIILNIKEKCGVMEDLIKITKSNSYHSFRTIKPENDDDEDEQIFEDGVLYWNRLTHRDITLKQRKFDK